MKPEGIYNPVTGLLKPGMLYPTPEGRLIITGVGLGFLLFLPTLYTGSDVSEVIFNPPMHDNNVLLSDEVIFNSPMDELAPEWAIR